MKLFPAFTIVIAACGSSGAQGPEGAAGTPGEMGTMGDKGDKGDTGDQGADGQLRIYGDGSAGALTVAADAQIFDTIAVDGNVQFTDVTINAGVTLTVPSGVTIRCSGTFTNNGTVLVESAALGGIVTASSTALAVGEVPALLQPDLGIGQRAAGSGGFGDATAIRRGGALGRGIAFNQARGLLRVGAMAGGGGGAGIGALAIGGSGGGSMVVLASVAIVNAGTIAANGEGAGAGAGGGAGGVVILASPGTITNTGSITAIGGVGGPGVNNTAPGGSGGGGLVHVLAPTITIGTVNVSGGVGRPAQVAGSVTTNPRSGGGGGGGGGGNGSPGGQVAIDGSSTATSPANVGRVLQMPVDPTALF